MFKEQGCVVGKHDDFSIFDALTMSFIKRMNKRDPKIEPWSTPNVTGKVSELM